MTPHVAHDFGSQIAERMVAAHQMLAAKWLERLNALLPVDANEVFPTDHLLDHIPSLIVEIAEYLREPRREEFAANTLMMTKARELGELRYQQKASVHQLLREYRILGGILATFVQEEAARDPERVDPAAAITLLTALSQAVSILEQTTVETFIGKYTATIERQTTRLENFNRMVSHELRQPIGALQFALQLARTTEDAAERAKYREVVDRNLARLNGMIDRLALISRLTPADSAQTQCLDLALVVREVARQLRDMAESRAVEIRIVEPFPVAVVDVAALELILINLVSNAIKYADPERDTRFVEISATSSDSAIQLCIRDNGIGISAERVPFIFDRAYRAHVQRDLELGTFGFGLGLAIVRDCANDQGWTLSVDSREGEGTTFTILVPLAPSGRME
ncbi:MAG TPA: HAMP domain-containing sensor histidine kinase [Vicinamibacterales bacterium]|nr:HAMP domain-containing sensor histidine kinase [Vicinamibacterales bacterium]